MNRPVSILRLKPWTERKEFDDILGNKISQKKTDTVSSQKSKPKEIEQKELQPILATPVPTLSSLISKVSQKSSNSKLTEVVKTDLTQKSKVPLDKIPTVSIETPAKRTSLRVQEAKSVKNLIGTEKEKLEKEKEKIVRHRKTQTNKRSTQRRKLRLRKRVTR
jgi:hypothetical protein